MKSEDDRAIRSSSIELELASFIARFSSRNRFAFPRTSWSVLSAKEAGREGRRERRRKRDALRLTAMIPAEANYVRGVRKDAGQFRREPSSPSSYFPLRLHVTHTTRIGVTRVAAPNDP